MAFLANAWAQDYSSLMYFFEPPFLNFLTNTDMNESTQYLLNEIKLRVMSGFDSEDDIDELIDDNLAAEDSDIDEALVRAAVAPEFARKLAVEKMWPAETDCDRLIKAFEKLNASGIIALHNAGVTQSDGLSDVGEELHQRGRASVKGYCFYHWQDVERAVEGLGLWLAFGDLDDNKISKAEIGKTINQVLEDNALKVEWNGSTETRLLIPVFDWKNRSQA